MTRRLMPLPHADVRKAQISNSERGRRFAPRPELFRNRSLRCAAARLGENLVIREGRVSAVVRRPARHVASRAVVGRLLVRHQGLRAMALPAPVAVPCCWLLRLLMRIMT